jgi:hypothetical protein
MNVDRVIFKDTNTADVGIIIRNSYGELIVALSMNEKMINGTGEIAAIQAISFAKKIGTQVIIEESLL